MLTKIKLFVDAHVFDGIPQGTVTFLSGIYSEIIKDERIELYIGSHDKTLAEKFLGSNKFIHIKFNSKSSIKRLLFEIPRALIKNKIDFAHFQYISPFYKPCKYIVTIHDLLFLEFPEYFPLIYRIKKSVLFYLSAKRADIITTVSNYSKKSIHRFFKIPMSNISIIPNAVSFYPEQEEPLDFLVNRKFILNVGRIEPRKNQSLLTEIWKELNLSSQNIDLVLVGAIGLEDKEFTKQIEEMSKQEKEHFHWLKEVPSSNLIWLYQNCSLFVYPSVAEGFGIPPLEAAIYGAKVLCSNKTAMAEFDFFGEGLFSPDDKLKFKNKISSTFKYGLSQSEMGIAIKNKYNWKLISENFVQKILNQ